MVPWNHFCDSSRKMLRSYWGAGQQRNLRIFRESVFKLQRKGTNTIKYPKTERPRSSPSSSLTWSTLGNSSVGARQNAGNADPGSEEWERESISQVRQWHGGLNTVQAPEGLTFLTSERAQLPIRLREWQGTRFPDGPPIVAEELWVWLTLNAWRSRPLHLSQFKLSHFWAEAVWHLFLWQFYGLCQLGNSIPYFMNAGLKYYSFQSLVCRPFMDVWGLFPVGWAIYVRLAIKYGVINNALWATSLGSIFDVYSFCI